MNPDALVGTQVGGIYAQLYSNGQTAGQVMTDTKMIMPLADLPLGERLYSAATIRKWLEVEDVGAALDVSDGYEHLVGADVLRIYRAMIAAKLQELEIK